MRCFLFAVAVVGLQIVAMNVAVQPPQSDALKQRIQKELEGKKAAEVAEPPVAEQAAALTKQLDSADEQVRNDAVSKLRLLGRRVDKFGGQREQRGEVFEPKVPGLLPLFVKAAHDKAEYVRFAATYALADTLDPAALPTLREMLNDPSRKVRVSAACLLTEFHDASGLPELKKAVLLYARPNNDIDRYMDGEKVLASLARITGKSFGEIPMNPMLNSNSEKAKASEQRYQELFDTWVAWWDWAPPGK